RFRAIGGSFCAILKKDGQIPKRASISSQSLLIDSCASSCQVVKRLFPGFPAIFPQSIRICRPMATGLPSFVAETTSQANVRPRAGHLLTLRYEDSGNVWFEAVHVQTTDVRAQTK